MCKPGMARPSRQQIACSFFFWKAVSLITLCRDCLQCCGVAHFQALFRVESVGTTRLAVPDPGCEATWSRCFTCRLMFGSSIRRALISVKRIALKFFKKCHSNCTQSGPHARQHANMIVPYDDCPHLQSLLCQSLARPSRIRVQCRRAWRT